MRRAGQASRRRRAKSFSAYLLLLSLALPVPGIARGADTFRIGQYYSDVLNGITFISNDQAAFLLRVGWINPGGGYQDNQVWNIANTRFADKAPDKSYSDLTWMAGTATIRLEWGCTGVSAAVGRVTVDSPVRVALVLTPAWSGFTSTYQVSADNLGFDGAGQLSAGGTPSVSWQLRCATAPLANISLTDASQLGSAIAAGVNTGQGAVPVGALVFDCAPGTPVLFSAGFGTLPDPATAGSTLDAASQALTAQRPTATGAWGDFVAPILNQLGKSKLYQVALPTSPMVAHTTGRALVRQGRLRHCSSGTVFSTG